MREAKKGNIYIEQFASDFVVTYPVLAQTKEDVLKAASISREYHFSYWDGLCIA